MRKTGEADAGVTDDDETPVIETTGAEPDDDDREDRPVERRAEAVRAPAVRRGFFEIYKPSQGFYTRMGTGIVGGVLSLWGAAFVYIKMSLVSTGPTTQYAQAGTAVAVLISAGLAFYWILALNRRVCDFLIATEGEMKKVNWTSRKEIIGSTKVVIFVVVAVAFFLFAVDIVMMLFFSQIKVLRIVPELFTRITGRTS